MRQLAIILAVFVGWWAICFGVNVFIYRHLPRTYLPHIKRWARFLTYGFPVVTIILVGLATRNLGWVMVALSPVILAFAFDFADSLAWAMADAQAGMLDW